VGNGPALGRMFSLGLNGNRILPKHIQMTLGVCLLKQLSALGRWSNWIEHAGVGDPRLGMVGNKLVAVRGNSNARKTRCCH
jgi:hypothetical protein